MKFSERKGYESVSDIIQTDGMNEELRNSIWNVLDASIWSNNWFLVGKVDSFSRHLWSHHFKRPADARVMVTSWILGTIRDYFFSCIWYEVYDFLEFVLNYFDQNSFNIKINSTLERELSGYRFVSGKIIDITNTQEIKMLETALSDNDFSSVSNHLQTALDLLSNKENPDYRNSIKESISAVESLARIITGKPKATLGQALKETGLVDTLHPALREAFSNLYGYTSDEDGIRHAMLEDPNLTSADAKYFLLTCTSFTNYLKSKM